MFNTCFIENKIPRMWRQSKIIAILKPGKDSAIPKNYRPISLLCHTCKLYERLISNRVSPLLEQHLIKQQAGFRPGKSCTSQLLNLTQHIGDGYQGGMITGAAFEDLSAAYDTVNHRILIQKLYNTTQDSQLCSLSEHAVQQKILLYADDLCITAQYSSFTEVETTIGDAQEELTQYYRSNSLRANPDKTQVTAFHLRNKEANRSLKVEWNMTKLENTPHPKYLGVTLDRTLSYKEHIHNTKMKVATRNNILRKLSTNSKWGANASTMRTTALALCYSVAEYAAPVWARSSHAQKLNPELNSACRAVNVEDPELRHPTSGAMYVLEWKIPNRKPMRLTLYMVRTRQRKG